MFKPIPSPARLDSLLLAEQINNYCQQIGEFSSQSLGKLFMSETLQKEPIEN
jgi:translation initiation factor 3 subunit H